MLSDMWNPNFQPMLHAKPANGFAYTPLELEGLMHIPVDGTQDVLMGPLAKRWEYFEHASKLAINTHREQDKATRDLLTRALLAEREDPAIFNLADFANDENKKFLTYDGHDVT